MERWLLLFYVYLSLRTLGGATAAWPSTVKIGALVALNSSAGYQAQAAMYMALQDITNFNSSLLNGTRLEMVSVNTNCSAFQGAAAAIELFKQNVVAIVGPQASAVAHFVAHMAETTQVPLVSASATDPTLSEYQFPYFLRLARSDRVLMQAVASVIGYFEWREVVAIYSDDDFGTNGINTLDDALVAYGASVVYKAAVSPVIDRAGFVRVLNGLAQLGSRIFVVHMQPRLGIDFFNQAHLMGMVNASYVWIVTEAITGVLESLHVDDRTVDGLLGVRSYVPQSPELESFANRWKRLALSDTGGLYDPNYSRYDLFAYDSIWLIARAIRNFLQDNRNFTFAAQNSFHGSGASSDFAKLMTLLDGQTLLKHMKTVAFRGLTGLVQLDKRGDPVSSSFEIVNMVAGSLQTLGYWTNKSGCTEDEPSAGNRSSSNNVQKLRSVYWPGNTTRKPRGWMLPKGGGDLIIGVPNKEGYKEFVDVSNNASNFHGFCIEVFTATKELLPYEVPVKFVSFGSGNATPSYDELVDKVVKKVYDGVVGDITITTKRAKLVDFTQPYATSGLVVVVPLQKKTSNQAWAFMRPFTATMWCTTGAFFLFTGIIMWLLEHKKNRDFRGRPRKQVVTTLWFSFSTLFFAQREDVKSTLGRAVLIIWLFVVLIINSSYTASLTSILTVQQLLPTIQNIAGLVASNVPIGYQAGSFVEEYLLQLNVPKDRLVPLGSLSAYTSALRKGPKSGGVGAIVDELPYVELFLSSECDFTIVGQQFTKSGWGFAFQKGSQLAVDMSTAILKLAENGDLQRIHDKWLKGYDCGSRKAQLESSELGLGTFWGLFLLTGTASILCLCIYFAKMLLRYRRFLRSQRECCSPESLLESSSRSSSFLKSFVSYVHESEVPEKRNSLRRSPESQAPEDGCSSSDRT